MSTENLPAAPEPQTSASGGEPAAVAPAPRKKRRGWVVALVIVFVLVMLGLVAFLIGDAIAKQYARDYVRERIVEVLALPADADVAVDVGSGSMIVQALAGRIDTVDVVVPEVAFGDLSGRLELSAEGVPLDETVPVEALDIGFAIGGDDLAALSQGEDAANAPDFTIADGELTLSSEFEFFGATLDWSLSAVPSAADAALVMSPTSLTIGSETFEAGADDDSFLGQIARALLQPRSLCIASEVPQALTLADASIEGEELVLSFSGDGAALGGEEFSTPGTCPEQ